MKIKLSLSLILLHTMFLFSQGVVEYQDEILIELKTYDSNFKIFKNSKPNRNDPESVIQSFFFAENNSDLNSNFLEETNYLNKSDEHYEAIKNLDVNNNYLIPLHKVNYNYRGSNFCYINFTFKIEGVDKSIPTNMSLIEKEGRWFIYQLANQIMINDILWRFKPCSLYNIFSNEIVVKDIFRDIITFKDEYKVINVESLYALLQNANPSFLSKYTLIKGNTCNDVEKTLKSYIVIPFLFEQINIEIYKSEQNKEIATLYQIDNKLKLDSEISLVYDNEQFRVLKYFENNVLKIKYLTNKKVSKPVKELLLLFEGLDSELIYNLFYQSINPNITGKEYPMIYEKSRGQLNSLNITKLYNLFKKEKSLFKNYLMK